MSAAFPRLRLPAHAFLPVLALTYLAGCTCGCPPGAEAPEQTPIETTSPHIGARWLDVAVAGDAMCAIRKKGGRVHCWGTGPIVDKAPRKGKFARLTAYRGVACALGSNARILCWGDDDGLGTLSEHPRGKFADVELGGNLGCALDEKGRVSCWPPTSFPRARGPDSPMCRWAITRAASR